VEKQTNEKYVFSRNLQLAEVGGKIFSIRVLPKELSPLI
jgi:hypothetical protein